MIRTLLLGLVALALHAQVIPIRVDAGSTTPYTDALGQVWSADTGFTGGGLVHNNDAVSGTPAPALYQTAHYGPTSGTPLTYQASVPNGDYTVNLKFDENTMGQIGDRVFNVTINGQTVLTNFDIFAIAGAQFQAVDVPIPVAVSNGQIAIQFISVVFAPRVCSIEILAGAPAAPTVTSLDPNTGGFGTAVPVTITGTNLSSDVVINAGQNITVSNVVVVSATELTATFNVAANAPAEPVNVTVTTAGGTTAPATFTLSAPAPPPMPTLSLSPQSTPAGATVIVPVLLAAPGTPISSIQFDVSFDASNLSLSSAPGSSISAALKSFYPAQMSNSQQRFLFAGSDATPIPDGTLINLLVSVAPTAALGDYALKISNLFASGPSGGAVAVSGADGTISVIAGGAALLSAGQVLNAASLQGGAVAPGELITLLGAGFRPSAGGAASDTSVSFNDIPSPLIYAGTTQINAIVPFGVAGQSTANITVAYQNQTLGGTTVPIATTAPGIFTLNSTGVGQGAILNQDYTVNSSLNPAARGSTISIYGTGAGPMNPPVQDGQVAASLSVPTSSVTVTMGGMDCPVGYVGSAPGLVNGVFQVNCQVPAGLNPGPSIPVVVHVGAASSQAGLTVAIE